MSKCISVCMYDVCHMYVYQNVYMNDCVSICMPVLFVNYDFLK